MATNINDNNIKGNPNNIAIELPPHPGYGAKELKILIAKFTFRAYLITVGAILVLVLLYIANTQLGSSEKEEMFLAPVVKIDLADLPPPSSDMAEAAPPPPMEQIIATGPAARAGTPVPVPDAQITADMKDFAKIDELARASAVGGDGIDLGDFSPGIDWDGKKEVVIQQEKEPGIDDFVHVEKEPDVDLSKLQRLVTYPDIARRAGIEGRVIVRILVGADGKIRNKVIQSTDNEMLNQAALDAIDKYGTVTPAIQNGEPITVWVSIPIQFRLR